MSSGATNRRRGFSLERELVNEARERGAEAERAWGSNGKSLGLDETVDCVIGGLHVQAKRVKKLAQYLYPPKGSDVQVFRADKQQALAVMPFSLLLGLIECASRNHSETTSSDSS